mmetsp:Transcript_48003/g.88363  ORF Transcript_48003/g.88363 Transcript_48003/m.88363 type:complete len:180 (+) Transcript_48003:82-621(+)
MAVQLARYALLTAALLHFASCAEYPNGTCGMQKADDCVNDFGSCGNACCTLSYSSTKTPEDVFASIKAYLSNGGSDGLYSFVNASDLRSYRIPGGYDYILQGTHTTFKKRYVDTLDFNIRHVGKAGSVVRAFSISNIAGALGDAGQNLRTLSILGSELGFADKEVVHGCGKAAAMQIHV